MPCPTERSPRRSRISRRASSIARATALQPTLVERQAEVEERTFYAEDVHRELQAAGIYRTFVPRRYGG